MSTGRPRDPGLWLMLHLRDPRDRRADGAGRCAVCGASARFVQNRWVIPADLARVAPDGLATRESQLCSACGANARVRRIGEVLLALYGAGATCVAEIVQEERFASLDVLELNSIGRMHPYLAPLGRRTFAEYPDEDVQDLSFADASFDLVLTSDTMEHVEEPLQGFREIRRVLRPGGRHVFSVPYDPRLEQTRSRAGLPPQYHGRGGGPYALVTRKADMLAHTDFGADLPELLRDVGFDTTVHGEGPNAVFDSVAV